MPDPDQTAQMPAAGENRGQDEAQGDDLELARKVAERVWQLWQQELRHERERRGHRS